MNVLSKLRKVYRCRKEISISLKQMVDLLDFQKEWRALNPNNGTVAKRRFDCSRVSVGEGTYGDLHVFSFGNPDEKLYIGNYCSIAGDVVFVLGGEHPTERITTFPYITHVLGWESKEYTKTKGPIIVEDDVWICHGALVLSGITIGRGSVIGAGCIVTKDIPPYTIYLGNGRIKNRFGEEIIKELKGVDLRLIRYLDRDKQAYLMNNTITDDNIIMIKRWFDEVKETAYP